MTAETIQSGNTLVPRWHQSGSSTRHVMEGLMCFVVDGVKVFYICLFALPTYVECATSLLCGM